METNPKVGDYVIFPAYDDTTIWLVAEIPSQYGIFQVIGPWEGYATSFETFRMATEKEILVGKLRGY